MGRKIKKQILLLILVLTAIYWQQEYMGWKEIFAQEISVEQEEPGMEEPDEEEIQEPLEKYELWYSEAGGENGYYTSIPELKLRHMDQRGCTRYRMVDGTGAIREGQLSHGEEICIHDEFTDGENRIMIWMEDMQTENDEGDIKFPVRQDEQEIVFMIDTLPPQLQVNTPQGNDFWYQMSTSVSVRGVDSAENVWNSGVKKIACYVNGNWIGEYENSEGIFLIQSPSIGGQANEVVLTATDYAGNQSNHVCSLYIDQKPPLVSIEGIEDYMITANPVRIEYIAREENALSGFETKTVWKDVDGKEQIIPAEEGKETEGNNQKSIGQILDRDGLYRMEIRAADKAGFESSTSAQIIIDSQNPVILKLEEIDGTYLQEFAFSYTAEECIQDYTSYTYEMRLDDNLYSSGSWITREGYHQLQISAVDAAGNQSVAKAGFVIDTTEPVIQILGVEDGTAYEEKAEISVQTEDSQDKIESIVVNGTSLGIKGGKRSYTYEFTEYGTYEIIVNAIDLAGNRAEKRVMFEVRAKETAVEKILKPVKKSLGFDTDTFTKKSDGELEETKERGHLRIFIVLAVLGAIVVVTGIYRKEKTL
ncbi:hypothetical protein [Sporofaciens sp. SGI.106]|uniref:hypothetical protein n=1 Tax=Sporofaciens sp. SGI.106 TaxID=3420568 RepID=UPI003D063CF8